MTILRVNKNLFSIERHFYYKILHSWGQGSFFKKIFPILFPFKTIFFILYHANKENKDIFGMYFQSVYST